MSNLISKHVELVVEDHGGTLFTFKLNTYLALSCVQKLDLNDSLFFDDDLWLSCLFLLFLFSGFGKCELPSLVGNLILGSILLERVDQLLKDLLGRVVREESCRLCQVSIVRLHVKFDNVRIFLFFFGQLFAHIDVICDLFTSARSSRLLLLHGHFAVFFFGSASFIDFVAFLEFHRDFFLSGNLALHPWVADDVSHAETLVWVDLEHAGNEVLELLGEEASRLSV